MSPILSLYDHPLKGKLTLKGEIELPVSNQLIQLKFIQSTFAYKPYMPLGYNLQPLSPGSEGLFRLQKPCSIVFRLF